MTRDYSSERDLFGPAFELAYFIHAHKEIAFFVAEDALDGLATTICRREKNRKPAERLQGFLKWGERSRPVRKTAGLDEEQTLQWLVYKQSEEWERATEAGRGLYLPTEEDMVVRYVAHLAFLTTRRGSFYVTLAVGSLLHQFNRRTARMFYDVLTQSDSARMKDTNYIGKQRLELLEKVARRFGGAVQTVRGPGDEKQFLMREAPARLNELVRESLRRCTPWGTACVIGARFEVTDIPGLYFSEGGTDSEDLIELNRMHTVLDPECFTRFARGLSAYVQTLPEGDRDKGCDFDRLDERLGVPLFSTPAGRPPRGDRFQAPKLRDEDYIRLERTLAARAHRRRNFTPRQVSVYVDDVLLSSFQPESTSRVRQLIGGEAGVVEVRGRDEVGELTLATLPPAYGHAGPAARGGTVVHPGGRRVTIRLTPARDAGGAGDSLWLEVVYAKPGLLRPAYRAAVLGRLGGNSGGPKDFGRAGAWALKVGMAAVLLLAASLFTWRRSQFRPPPPEAPPAGQVARQGDDEQGGGRAGAVTIVTPSPSPETPVAPKKVSPLMASAAWSTEREAALRAVPLEVTRGESRVIDVSRRDAKVLLSLPRYDEEGAEFIRYRLTLSAAGSRLWRQTLGAPKVSLTGYAHILALSLFERRLPGPGPYTLTAEGLAKGSWRPVGSVALGLDERRGH